MGKRVLIPVCQSGIAICIIISAKQGRDAFPLRTPSIITHRDHVVNLHARQNVSSFALLPRAGPLSAWSVEQVPWTLLEKHPSNCYKN